MALKERRGEERTLEIKIPSYKIPGSWLIGATTYAIDRIIPDVERIWVPEQLHDFDGWVRFRLIRDATAPAIKRTSRKRRLLNYLRPPAPIDLGERVFFDARNDDYFNWSHQANFYLSLALAARKWIGEDVVVILPMGMPPITFDLYRLFGFETISTDGAVTGRQCAWSVSHWEVLACGRKILVPDDYELPHFDTPPKVLIGRRRLRAITNEAEVEAALPGYTKVFTEDLSAAEQFALFRNATHIVSVHGAALAPMQYRPKSAPSLRLIEIAPAGMMTRWFAIMCDQIGGRYIQVRGRFKPEYVRYLYGNEPFVKYTNDNFEVDPVSLKIALEMVESDAW